MAAYYDTMRALFPDAGARLIAFNQYLFERVIPLLERRADIGRPYPLRRGARLPSKEQENPSCP